MNLIQTLEKEEIERLGKKIPEFAPGDTVIVSVNVVEGTLYSPLLSSSRILYQGRPSGPSIMSLIQWIER